jgi:hypothetical protein
LPLVGDERGPPDRRLDLPKESCFAVSGVFYIVVDTGKAVSSRTHPDEIIILKGVTIMPSGLEDRIRQLCAQAIAAKSEAELQFISPQLRKAIRDHIRYCRALAVEVIPEAFGGDSNAAD